MVPRPLADADNKGCARIGVSSTAMASALDIVNFIVAVNARSLESGSSDLKRKSTVAKALLIQDT